MLDYPENLSIQQDFRSGYGWKIASFSEIAKFRIASSQCMRIEPLVVNQRSC